MSDLQSDFMGKNGFVWWTGVVEDIDDPLKIGRLRVRIIGFHTEDKVLLPTKSLPWAVVLQPVTSAAVSGIGTSPTGVVNGSWVMGFFKDGWSAQDPVVMGTFAGIPENLPNKEQGFNDPNETYPTSEYIGESDVNRLARGQATAFTIVNSKRQTRVQGIRTALGGAWSEPGTPYKAIYPMNTVTQSRAGHIIEIDDTRFAPRIHIYHKSGSFKEWHPDGTVVDKVVGDGFEIDLKNKKIVVKGNSTETVDGSKRDLVGGNYMIEVLGNLNTFVHGDHYVQTKGNYYHKVDGTYTVVSGGKALQIAPRIDFNPPEKTINDFPDVTVLKDTEPSTTTTSTTRGNEAETEPVPQNLKNVQNFDTRVAILEKQKGEERLEKTNPVAQTAKTTSQNSIPSPQSLVTGSPAAKVEALAQNNIPTEATSPSQASSYLLPSKKKDCQLYCTEVVKNTGGTIEDFEACVSECESYNREIDSRLPSKVGGDGSCGGGLDDLGIGGVIGSIEEVLGDVQAGINDAISGIQSGIEGIGEGIFGTKEERWCKDAIKDECSQIYAARKRLGGFAGNTVPKRSEFMKECQESPDENGKTPVENCIQWAKDNPDEFNEIIAEEESETPVPSVPKTSDLGPVLDFKIPGLPSIPCLGIGLAVIGGALGAGIALATGKSVLGGVAIGAGAGLAAGVLAGGLSAASSISPTVETVTPPEPAPPDNTADGGSF